MLHGHLTKTLQLLTAELSDKGLGKWNRESSHIGTVEIMLAVGLWEEEK